MMSLFFEVLPKAGQDATYFEIAAKLKPALDASGGLLFLDRSRSAARPGWFLSHQFWRDEASMVRWRADPTHHRAQVCGRTDVLADYRLRVGEVIASIGEGEPPAEAHSNSGETGRYVVSVLAGGHIPGLPGESFASVYDAALSVIVIPVATVAEGQDVLARAGAHSALRFARLSRISRDYGMSDRTEAPQHFEPVTLS